MSTAINSRDALVLTGLLAVAMLSPAAAVWGEAQSAPPKDSQSAQCRPTGPLVQIPELPEASGVAISRSVPGRLWSHNDSGQAQVFAIDAVLSNQKMGELFRIAEDQHQIGHKCAAAQRSRNDANKPIWIQSRQ